MFDFKRNLAVIIGINDYENVTPLGTAVNDAKKLAEILRSQPQPHNYEIVPLEEAQPGLTSLKTLLDHTLPNVIKPTEQDRLLFYFAGHGYPADSVEGPAGYLVPRDAQPGKMESFLPMEDLHFALLNLDCRHLLIILDCCFAGSFRWAVTRHIAAPTVMYRQRFERYTRHHAWQVITSAAHDQKAFDVLFDNRAEAGVEHSPFAEALFEALEKGTADVNGDGIVTATELYLHLSETLRDRTLELRQQQVPGLWPLRKHDKGEFIFILNKEFNPENLDEAPPIDPENNPYRGLESFEAAQSKLFFGRDEPIEELYKRITQPDAETNSDRPFTVVLGISGSGKSSLVKAGLIPYLTKKEAGLWQILEPMRPGTTPFLALAKAILPIANDSVSSQDSIEQLSQLLQNNQTHFSQTIAAWHELNQNQGKKLLLVIDQFEELITQSQISQIQQSQDSVEQKSEWQKFLDVLAVAIQAQAQHLRIVVTLRSDFEPRFLNSALKEYWASARFPVRAMRADELRQAIEKPAEEKALFFEPSTLVDRLIEEVGQMPGALPLLSFTLSELYNQLARKWKNEETSDRALTLNDKFRQEGGLAGSLTRRSNEVYQQIGETENLGAAAQATMRRVMLRMLTLEGGETTRRKVPESELVYPTPDENERVKQVVNSLVDARLLVKGQLETGEPYVEPAHDFLVRGWGVLQDWINEEKAKETLELQQRLTAQANDWDGSNRPNGLLLLDGDRLKQLEFFLQSVNNWFNQQEQDYVENSSKQAQKQRLKDTLPQEGDRISNLLQIRPVEGMILAIKSIGQNLDVMPEDILAPTQVALSQAIHMAKEENVILAHTQVVSSIAFNRQGTLIVSGSYDKTLQLWDKFGNASGELFCGHDFAVWSVDFHLDGEIIATGSHDSTIRLWDLQGNSVRQPFEGHQANVLCVNFSPDGTMIASCGDDQKIILWDLEGNIICDQFDGHKATINCVTFHPDKELIASASNDGTVRLWNFKGDSIITIQAHTKVVSPIFQFDGEAVRSVAFNPDGDRILSTGEDGTLRQWNLQGYPISEPFRSLKYNALSSKYSPDGRTIFSANGTSLYCWDLDGNFISQIRGHSDHIEAFAFSPDGKTVVTGSRDKTIRFWSLQEFSSGESVSPEYPNQSVAFSSDGNSILVGCARSIYQWNLQGALIKQFRRFSTGIRASANLAIAFKPRNDIFASYGSSNTLYLQKLQGELIQELVQEHTDTITCIEFSPTQELLVSSSYDGTICLWHLEGKLITRFPKESLESINSVAFSPNGEVIASGGDDSILRLWDLHGQLIQSPFQGHESAIMSVSFSSDGKIIASGSNDKTVRLWSLEGKLLATLYGHTGRINRVVFSPKDDLLASCSDDRTIRLWDSKGNLIGYPLQGHDQQVNAIAFSPDGKVIASIDNLTMRLWSVGWQPWLGICCDRLRYHPVFKNPESIEDLEQREIAIAACETCKKYVWNHQEDKKETSPELA